MSKTSKDQYGRKSWNVEAYEEEARKGSNKRKAETVLDKHHQINDASASSYISHRTQLIQDAIGKVKVHSIIDPTDLLAGGHVRFGFTCPVCTFSFKDNLALIDHINSPQHLAKVKQLSKNKKQVQGDKDDDSDDEETEELDGGIRRATLADVINTMESMVEQKIRNRTAEELVSMQGRIDRRKQFERQWQEKRRRRRESKKKKKNVDVESGSEDEVAVAMGFLAFGSR